MATSGIPLPSNVVTLEDIPKPPAWVSKLSVDQVKEICGHLEQQPSAVDIDFSDPFLPRLKNVLSTDVHRKLCDDGLSKEEKTVILLQNMSSNRRAFERLMEVLKETDQYKVLDFIKNETTAVKTGKEAERKNTSNESGTKKQEVDESNNDTDTGKDEPDTPEPIPAHIQQILDMNKKNKTKKLEKHLDAVEPELLKRIKITNNLVASLRQHGITVLDIEETLKNKYHNNNDRVAELMVHIRRNPIPRVRALLASLVANGQDSPVEEFDKAEVRACLGYSIQGEFEDVIKAETKPPDN